MQRMNDETILTMALTRISGLSLRNALLLYRAVGSASEIFNNVSALQQHYPDIQPKALKVLDEGAASAIERAKEEGKFCADHDITCLTLNGTAYPTRLRQCDDAPLTLFYRGTGNLNAAHILSVVGTRRCTEYGKDLCRNITSELANLMPDTLVVSGLAYGIDIHAHRGALDSGLETVAVLAHGLDRIYPVSHRDTAKRIVGHGGLLTEYMTGTTPDKGNFVRRNRIVAGICDACIVVESAQKGGALITARLAFDYDRQVFACPGRVSDMYSEGCNELIRRQTATPLLRVQDLLDELGWMTAQERQQALEQPRQAELFPILSSEELAIVNVLRGTDGMQINRLAQQLGCPVQKASSLLFEMEMKDIVKPLPGGVYRLLGNLKG